MLTNRAFIVAQRADLVMAEITKVQATYFSAQAESFEQVVTAVINRAEACMARGLEFAGTLRTLDLLNSIEDQCLGLLDIHQEATDVILELENPVEVNDDYSINAPALPNMPLFPQA